MLNCEVPRCRPTNILGVEFAVGDQFAPSAIMVCGVRTDRVRPRSHRHRRTVSRLRPTRRSRVIRTVLFFLLCQQDWHNSLRSFRPYKGDRHERLLIAQLLLLPCALFPSTYIFFCRPVSQILQFLPPAVRAVPARWGRRPLSMAYDSGYRNRVQGHPRRHPVGPFFDAHAGQPLQVVDQNFVESVRPLGPARCTGSGTDQGNSCRKALQVPQLKQRLASSTACSFGECLKSLRPAFSSWVLVGQAFPAGRAGKWREVRSMFMRFRSKMDIDWNGARPASFSSAHDFIQIERKARFAHRQTAIDDHERLTGTDLSYIAPRRRSWCPQGRAEFVHLDGAAPHF